MEKVIAVTGASGRLGRVLVGRLAADPSVERILALDRQPVDHGSAKVEFRECDVRDDGIAEHFADAGAVVHLAFIVETGSRDQQLVEQVNVGGTQNVMAAAARAGVHQVVYASSIAAYGFHPGNLAGPLAEDAPVRGNPEFYYSRTKADVEHWLDAFESAHPDVKVARLRPSIFWSADAGKGIELFRRPLFPHLRTKQVLPVHVTHTDDVAQAFHLALRHDAHGAFNIATDEPLPMSQWAAQMGKHGIPIPEQAITLAALAYRARISDVDPVWMRLGSQFPITVSTAKARRKLRWRPRYATTGAVLRALAEQPTAIASRGTKILFGSLATITNMRGSLPLGERERAELRAFAGAANLVFTGERPSEWHFSVRDGRIGVHRGLAADARATTTMDESTFFAMLSGELSYSRATMTGRMRFSGDTAFGMLIGGMVAQFQRARTASGRRWLPARAFTQLVLRTGPATASRRKR